MTTPRFVQTLPSRLQDALGERYRIVRPLGGEELIDVYLAFDGATRQSVLLKVLSPALISGVDLGGFRREFLRATTLTHPRVSAVLECGLLDGVPFYTTPLVAGESLRARLATGPLLLDDARPILRDVVDALAYTHAQGIAHRDLRPEHIALTSAGAVLTDVGVAQALILASAQPIDSLARIGLPIGAPAYFAPEMARGEPSDARADWYALGVTAFEMLAGRPPFVSSTRGGVLVGHATEAVPSLAALRPDVPPEFIALIARLLAKDPGQRLSDPMRIARALDAPTTLDDSSRESTFDEASEPESPPFTTRLTPLAAIAVRTAATKRDRTPSAGSRLQSRDANRAGARASHRDQPVTPQTSRRTQIVFAASAAMVLLSAFGIASVVRQQVPLAPAPDDSAQVAANTNTQREDSLATARTERADLTILNRIATDPGGALIAARSALAAGQTSATVMAMAAIGAGHPREALAALDRLGSRIDTVAGAPMGAEVTIAMRAEAHYLTGSDSLALRTVETSLGVAPPLLGSIGYPIAAALGDSMRWSAFINTARVVSPDDRVAALLLSGDIARMAGHDSLAVVWYRRAAQEAAPRVAAGKALPALRLNVALAERGAHNTGRADSLLAALEQDRDTDVARRARYARMLVSFELHHDSATMAAERIARDDAQRGKRWDAALSLARLYALRGNLDISEQFLRTTLALGMPYLHRTPGSRVGDTRAEPDLRSLLSTPGGRALLRPLE